jgi:RNA polymerase sigma factor (sigma-70 family)
MQDVKGSWPHADLPGSHAGGADLMSNPAQERHEMIRGTGSVHDVPGSASVEDSLQPHERLNMGDVGAVEKAFLAYESELRALVRRQIPQRLRAKFDSVDVVQGVWTSVLQSLRAGDLQFTDESHLRAYLIRLALFRFIDLCRRYRIALGREWPLAALDARDVHGEQCERPSQLLQANELLDRLMNLCSPGHRELVRLRMMGLPLSELAARTGFHESSIRRIFYDLARKLDAQKGDAHESAQTENATSHPSERTDRRPTVDVSA